MSSIQTFAPRYSEGAVAQAQNVNLIKVITVTAVCIVATQKLAVPLGSSNRTQVALALILEFGMLFYLYANGRAFIHRIRLIWFLAIAGLAVLLNVFRPAVDYSPPALLLFITILSMYVFVIPITSEQYRRLMQNFVVMGMIASGLVWVDWVTQLAHLGMPNVETFVPKLFLYREYNYLKQMWWGALKFAPNGVVFLEPSHVSQFIGMALIVEAALFQRVKRMVFLAISLLASFGGTGLLLCVICSPLLLFRLKPVVIFAGLVALPAVLVVALQLGALDNIAKRSGEIGGKNASATIRFVLPIEAATGALTGPTDAFLGGKGPGTMPKGLSATASFAWAPYAKLIVEYGFPIFVLWIGFLLYCNFPRGIPAVIGLAGFTQFFLLNGSLGVPLNTFYCLLLAGSYLIVRPSADLQSEAEVSPQVAMGSQG
jgi:hypothetical protein